MDVLGTIVSVIAGLFGGALGGVLTAGKIARSAERARRQFEAEEGVRAAVTVYRATMVFDHEQLYEVSHFSTDYTSVAGQETFAGELLARMPYLPHKVGEKLRTELRKLLGDLTYNLAVQRAFVPQDRLDPDREGQRQALVLFQVLHSEEDEIEGTLRQMLASQNRGEYHNDLYKLAVGSLDRMLDAVASTRSQRMKRRA